ncbi:MAG: [protein-PII] uridylyltransferase [Gammaproteobacteria bacterium]|nr:[protein-PII] uridylyltransferase [Gammaproteobacteria bacterium]
MGAQLTPIPDYISSQINWEDCEKKLAQSSAISDYVNCLERSTEMTDQAFDAGVDIVDLVKGRAAVVDRILGIAWKRFKLDQAPAALVAVGGYGRGELHPGSDIDLLLLFADEPDQAACESISDFLTFLWDIKFQVGHSVRTLSECEAEAADDITIATNLTEARLLIGDEQLFETMRERTGPDYIWPSPDFFAAKLEEQNARHERFDDTGYKVEPNLKDGPGGLRDFQMIAWVTKRHFGAQSLKDLIDKDFLQPDEYDELFEGQKFLWRIRYALHRLTGRKEERLLFDYQKTLALQFGFEDGPGNLAVEVFMQTYYRTIMGLERLNEMLLQHYEEELLQNKDEENVLQLNPRFRVRNGYLEVTSKQIFTFYTPAILESFLLLQLHPEIKGIRASTIRSIRNHLHLIDEQYRSDIRCRTLFMEILRQPHGITHQLRRMNRYGVLAAYLPNFANIVGRMQYDLFHVFTVDEHILMVLRNVRRIGVKEFEEELPLCSMVFKNLPKPELLYIAALFHDIAKGRGGDHSELGAVDAEAFCLEHDLSSFDAKLVAWLVKQHLFMSMTAQQRDINDPDVVLEFAKKMGNTNRLDYLFLLTVADMRGTNPNKWNSWKYSLLSSLYKQASKVLRRGLDNPADHQELVEEIKQGAEQTLLGQGLSDEEISNVWNDFEDDLFLRYTADDIVAQTRLIARTKIEDLPVIVSRHNPERGSTEIFIYDRDKLDLFSEVTRSLEKMHLNILDARILTTRSGMAADTFHVHGANGEPITDKAQLQEISDRLRNAILDTEVTPLSVQEHRSRQHKHFEITTRLHFYRHHLQNVTVMELIAVDRPGLLSRVAKILKDMGIRMHMARIATIGAKADDMLYITDEMDQPLSDEVQEKLRVSIIEALDGTQ